MTKFILLLLLSSSYVFASHSEDAQKYLDELRDITTRLERLDTASQKFVGLPYGQGGPLGEGEDGRYDRDPLYRFDTYDCTTFVETMVSLARSFDLSTFEQEMNDIRYENGEVGYLTRNHFTDLAWIPNNVRNGLLSEINNLVLPVNQQKTAEALINLPGWLKSLKITDIKAPLITDAERLTLLEELHAEAQHYSPVVAKLPYIAIATVLARPSILTKIPHGAIVNFVRPNWDLTEVAGTHQNISHQGFLFWKGKKLYLRHASTSGSVREDLFIDYLKKFANHATLKGIHLMKMN
mgnify:CR=1 FL=1